MLDDIKRTDGDDNWVVWSPNSLSILQSCFYKFHLSKDRNLTIPGKSYPAHFGNAIHKALEMYDLADHKTDSDLFYIIIKVSNEYALQEAGQYDSRHSPLSLLRILIEYQEYEKLYPTQAPDFPYTEVSFEIPLPLYGHKLIGIIDKIVMVGKDYYILDRKSTKQTLSDKFYLKFAPSLQTSAYVWALREIGIPIKGFLIEAIQYTTNFVRIERKQVPVSDQQITEFLRQLTYYVEEYTKQRASGEWVRNYNSCNAPYRCTFIEVCTAPKNIVDLILENDYTTKTTEEPIDEINTDEETD